MPNERELVNNILEGREEYFEQIVDEHKNKVYNFVLNIIYNREDAQEIVMEAFYRFYKDLKNFKGHCKISTYIYQIAKNLCKDYIKKKKAITASLEEMENFIQTGTNSEEIYIKKEESRQILNALKSLKNGYKEAIILRELEGLSYEQISEILNENINTVKTKIRRARQDLALQLKDMVRSDAE
ncbi:MAG: RNA polymerase sigma factor [Armatimonadota bacterium]